MVKLLAPTRRMIPVSRRRLKAAARMVLLMSSSAASSCTPAMVTVIRSTLDSPLKNGSSRAFWSCTSATPGRSLNALATTANWVGSSSLTRKDSGSASTVTFSTRSGESLNCSWKTLYAIACDS